MGLTQSKAEKRYSNSCDSCQFLYVSSSLDPLAIYSQGSERGSSHSLFAINTITGKTLQIYEGHTREVNVLAVTSDNIFMVTGSQDCSCILWSVRTGTAIRTFGPYAAPHANKGGAIGHIKQITALAITPDNDYFISSGQEGWAFLWELDSGRPLCCMKGRHNFDPKSGESYEDTHSSGGVNNKKGSVSKGVSSLILIEDDYVITASDDGTCVVWAIHDFVNKSYRHNGKGVKNLHDDIWPEPEEQARLTNDIPRARAVVVINKFNTGHRRNVGISCMALGLRGGKAKKRVKKKRRGKRMRMSAVSPKSRDRVHTFRNMEDDDENEESEDDDLRNIHQNSNNFISSIKSSLLPKTSSPSTIRTTKNTETTITTSIAEKALNNLEIHVLFTAGTDGSIAMWSLAPPDGLTDMNTSATTWDPPEPLRVFIGHGKNIPITRLLVVDQTRTENQKLISAAEDGTTFAWNASSSSIFKGGLRTTKPLKRFVIGTLEQTDEEDSSSKEYEEGEEEVEEEEKKNIKEKDLNKKKGKTKYVTSICRVEAGDIRWRQSIMRFGLNPRHAGHFIYAGLSNGSIACWDLNQNEEFISGKIPEAKWLSRRSYVAHNKKSCTEIKVDVRTDSVSIVSCGKDKKLYMKLIEGKNGTDRSCIGWCHTINAFTMDRNETRMICTFGNYAQIYMFNSSHGHFLGTFEGHKKRVNCLQVIQSERHQNQREFLISGSYDNSVRVWNLNTRECLCTQSDHHVGYIYDLAVSQDIAITASRDTSLAMWRLSEDRKSKKVTLELKTTFGVPRSESVRNPSRPLQAHPNRVWCCSLYPRDQNVRYCLFFLLLLLSCTHIIVTQRTHTHTHTHQIQAEFLASGGNGGEIIVWDLRRSSSSSTQIQFVLEGHTQKVYCLVFATVCSDGDVVLISGGADTTLRVWSMRDGTCMQVLNSRTADMDSIGGHFAFHTSDIRSLAVLKDIRTGNDAYIISGAQDKSMVVMNLSEIPFRIVESVRDSHSDKITKIQMSNSGKHIYSVSSGVVRFDAKALIDWHVVKFTTFFQKHQGGNMVSRSPFVSSFGSVVAPLVEYSPFFEYILNACLLLITIAQLAAFAVPFEAGAVASELQPLESLFSYMKDFGLLGKYIDTYWISLGPTIAILALFVFSMIFQEYIELKAFLTASKKWKLLFNAVSLYAKIMSTVAVLPVLGVLLNVVNFHTLVEEGDGVGEFPDLNITTCSWVDSVESPLSETKYLVEDHDNFTELFSTTHIVYISIVIVCLLTYLPYVYRLQRVCGDLKRINASLNPIEMSGDDTEYVPLRRNPLSLNGDTRFEMGLIVCKMCLVLIKVFFGNASVDYDQYVMIFGQSLVILIGVAFVVLVLICPPHFQEMRVMSEIFQASLVCVLWCYILGFVTVLLQPGCGGVDDSILTIVQLYVPLISSPIVFLITVFVLGRRDNRDGAWEYFSKPLMGCCHKRISSGGGSSSSSSSNKVSPIG